MTHSKKEADQIATAIRTAFQPMKKRKRPTSAGFTIAILWVFALAAATSLSLSLASGKFHPANHRIDQKRFMRTEDPTHYWTLVGFMGGITMVLTSGAGYLSYCAIVQQVRSTRSRS